jgi:hypothetical protein
MDGYDYATQLRVQPLNPLNWKGQLVEMPANGYGICDRTTLAKLRTSALPLQYSKVIFSFTVAAGSNVAVLTPQTQTAFVVGQNESGQGFLKNTGSQTIAYEQGAFIKDGQNFTIQTFGFECEEPIIITQDQATPPNQIFNYREFQDWMSSRVQKAVYDNIFAKYFYPSMECSGDLGLIKYFTMPTAKAGGGGGDGNGQIVTTGQPTGGPSSLFPLRRTLVTGSQVKQDQIQIQLSNGQQLNVEGAGAFPIPPDVTSIAVPILVTAYGYPDCAPKCMPACVTPRGEIVISQNSMEPPPEFSTMSVPGATIKGGLGSGANTAQLARIAQAVALLDAMDKKNSGG